MPLIFLKEKGGKTEQIRPRINFLQMHCTFVPFASGMISAAALPRLMMGFRTFDPGIDLPNQCVEPANCWLLISISVSVGWECRFATG